MTTEHYALLIYLAGAAGMAIAVSIGMIQDRHSMWSDTSSQAPGAALGAGACLAVVLLSAVWPLSLAIKGVEKLRRRNGGGVGGD